jgi:hypothetical protein
MPVLLRNEVSARPPWDVRSGDREQAALSSLERIPTAAVPIRHGIWLPGSGPWRPEKWGARQIGRLFVGRWAQIAAGPRTVLADFVARSW